MLNCIYVTVPFFVSICFRMTPNSEWFYVGTWNLILLYNMKIPHLANGKLLYKVHCKGSHAFLNFFSLYLAYIFILIILYVSCIKIKKNIIIVCKSKVLPYNVSGYHIFDVKCDKNEKKPEDKFAQI